MQFDNHDCRIRYYHLLLERDLDDIPEFSLPDGYRFVFFQPGDRDMWIEIERSAREVATYEQGMKAWNKYYAAHEGELYDRMVFIENAAGEKIATATAFYDVINHDPSGSGWMHWVAVRREYQGRGLSKPLISHVLHLLRELGYTHGKVPTQTTTWLACKIYMDFGFRPVPENIAESRDGWRIMKALTGHAALADFDPASMEEILAEPSA
ncbi:MAG: GNAT family N-acetyltransferase [Oscillospiraceae bacterium]|nr:GNAT family N-acetyltransferase [Oscillospiraceae bacterium]